MNTKMEDPRPSFVSIRALDIILPSLGSSSAPISRQDTIDQLSEAVALLDGLVLDNDNDGECKLNTHHRPSSTAHQMTFQEDESWQEFCEDLPLR